MLFGDGNHGGVASRGRVISWTEIDRHHKGNN